MDSITDKDSAMKWVRAWSGNVRPGILKEVIRGIKMRQSIMKPPRYSDREINDNKAALVTLIEAQ